MTAWDEAQGLRRATSKTDRMDGRSDEKRNATIRPRIHSATHPWRQQRIQTPLPLEKKSEHLWKRITFHQHLSSAWAGNVGSCTSPRAIAKSGVRGGHG